MMRSVKCTFRFFLAFTLIAILVAIFSDNVFAAVYYLHPAKGNDGNPGTQGSPWKTMVKVRTTVAAGDTVNIIGGTYTPAQYMGESGDPVWTETHSHGTAGNPIMIQANPGDTVIFDGQQQAYWMIFRAFGINNGYYVIMRNITFQNYAGVAIGVGGGPFPSHHVAVIGCILQNFSANSTGALATAPSAHHVIYRNNRVINIGDPSFGGTPRLQHGIYPSENAQFVVIDGNYVEKIGGYGIHLWGHDDYSVTSQNIIIRTNTVVNAHEQAGLIISGTNYTNTYIYNNTFYQEQIPFPQIDSNSVLFFLSSHNGASFQTMKILNNIGYGHASGAPVESDDNTRFNGTLTLNYNLWQNLTGSNNLSLWDYNASTYYTLTSFRTTFGYETQTLQTNPLFTNASTRNFTLQSTSPAIDAGTFLTTTVGSGSGTTLTVADAGFFTDGFGLVAGDTIQIGSNTPVQITAINYGTNAITVAGSISWSNGQGVSLPYSGARPDIGAYEYKTIGSPTLPSPANLRIIQQ